MRIMKKLWCRSCLNISIWLIERKHGKRKEMLKRKLMGEWLPIDIDVYIYIYSGVMVKRSEVMIYLFCNIK